MRCASTIVLPSRVGLKAQSYIWHQRPGRFCPDCAGKLEAPAKQIHRHHPLLGEHIAAIGIELGTVEHRRCSIVVVQIHLQRIHRALPARLCNFQEASPNTTSSMSLSGGNLNQLRQYCADQRVDLNRRGVHLAAFCSGTWSARQRPNPAALRCARQCCRAPQTAATHHALHVLRGLISQGVTYALHGALHPGRAQVQVSARSPSSDTLTWGRSCFGLRWICLVRAWRRRRVLRSHFSRLNAYSVPGLWRCNALHARRCRFALPAPSGIGRAGKRGCTRGRNPGLACVFITLCPVVGHGLQLRATLLKAAKSLT